MTRPPLDYAAVRPSRPSAAAARRLIIAGCCIGGSWLVWLGIFLQGVESHDPFDDGPLVGWLLMTMVGMGTLCGLILYVIALLGLWLWSTVRRHRRSAS